MNKVILIGRLTRDPEIRYTQSGKAVCNFALAVNRPFGDNEAEFINIVVWNKIAENAAKYLAKGSQCAVEGRLQISSYEGNDSVRKYRTDVVASSVEFLSSKQKSNSDYDEPSDYESSSKSNESDVFAGEEVFFADEDLPF